MTELEKLGLTREHIMAGERAEFDVVKPKLRDKSEYVQKALVDMAIAAYADDLLAAYEKLDELTAANEALTSQLDESQGNVDASQKQVSAILESEDTLAQAEKMLASLEAYVNKLKSAHQADAQTINQLQSAVNNHDAVVMQLKAEIDNKDGLVTQLTEEATKLRASIDELRDENSNLHERDTEYGQRMEQLEQDVNSVLDNLRGYFQEAGIETD